MAEPVFYGSFRGGACTETMKSSPWWFECADAMLLRMPASVERVAQRTGRLMWDAVRRWPVRKWRGTTGQGQSVLLLTVGDSPHVDYLARRWLGETVSVEPMGRLWRWQVGKVAAEADVIVWRMSQWSAQLMAKRAALHLPDWVATVLPVSVDIPQLARVNGSLWEDLRLVRNRGWRMELSPGETDLPQFYEDFYEPFVGARHGLHTVWTPPDWLARRLGRGGVLWLTRDGQRLAGVAFAQHGRTLALLSTGVRLGNKELLRQGAMAAVYYFSWELARMRGCDAVDFGGCRPSLRDGLLQYKRKWGMRVRPKSNCHEVQCVQWREWGAIMEDFLDRVAPICWFGGRLGAVTVRGGHDANGTRACPLLPGLEHEEVIVAGASAWRPPHPYRAWAQ
ncbi:MAG: hypothetical protein RMM51_09935 [Verrucomicrobiae bacterium]|nr:hypothetical protein [Verrucomicrobiae bacterium]